MIKRIVTAFTVAAILLSQANFVYAADNMKKFITDGNIQIDFDGPESGEEVIVIVTPEDMDWLNETAWKNETLKDNSVINDFNYLYFDTVTAGIDGKYSVDFVVSTDGTYNVVYGNEKIKIKYVDAGRNELAIQALLGATNPDEVKAVLENPTYILQLMLDDEIFIAIKNDTKVNDDTKTPIMKVSEMVYENMGNISFPVNATQQEKSDYINSIIYKACLAVMLNGEATAGVQNIDDYIKYMDSENGELTEYYVANTSSVVTNQLKKSRITNLTDFDNKFIEAVLLTNIRYNDGLATVINMLEEYHTRIGVTDTGKITEAVVNTMVGTMFESALAVGTYINNWVAPVPPTPGYSSGAGGGSSSRNPSSSVSGSFMAPPKENSAGNLTSRSVFEDTESVHWAEEAINALALKGIISGRTQTEFMPNEPIKREEFVKLIISLLSLNVVGSEPVFDDVSETDWFYPYLKSAYNAEIISGISENLFGTGMNITRQDMAVIVARSAYIAGVELSEVNPEKEFSDSDRVSDYAKESVIKLQKAGIMSGNEKGEFLPNENATRAQAAQIIYMMYKQLV